MLAPYRLPLLILCILFFVAGIIIIIWPYIKKETDLQIALRLRNQLQTLLDEIGEEPKIKYVGISEKAWNEQLEKWRKHKLQLVHKFRRRHLPKIQDFIHRLGERGITDNPLNIMIDHDPQSYADIKEITDRLSIMIGRMSKK